MSENGETVCNMDRVSTRGCDSKILLPLSNNVRGTWASGVMGSDTAVVLFGLPMVLGMKACGSRI